MNADPIKYEVDKESGAIFVDRFMGLVLHVIDHTARSRGIQVSPEDREDLCAQVFLEIIKNEFAVLRHFRRQSSLATYLTVVSRRVVVHALVGSATQSPSPVHRCVHCEPVNPLTCTHVRELHSSAGDAITVDALALSSPMLHARPTSEAAASSVFPPPSPRSRPTTFGRLSSTSCHVTSRPIESKTPRRYSATPCSSPVGEGMLTRSLATSTRLRRRVGDCGRA